VAVYFPYSAGKLNLQHQARCMKTIGGFSMATAPSFALILYDIAFLSKPSASATFIAAKTDSGETGINSL
jgi:hypothetical protein